MNILRSIWGLLFRLFPCPTPLGLRRIGDPGRDSPVLVTCNFHLTVERLTRELRGLDVWLLVAESRGVNVWCAAGGDEFTTHSVVAAVKTSGVAELVDHRVLVLPPLGAPGIRASDVERETGWTVCWGPVRATDIPRFLAGGMRVDERMRRATYTWAERMDTGLGSLFPFYLVVAAGFAFFGRALLPDYLFVGAAAFLVFMTAVPWLPTAHGLTKALLLDLLLGAAWITLELLRPGSVDHRAHADLVIAMVVTIGYGLELGGLAPTMRSDLDPLLARLGVHHIGNVAFAGTVRTDLLNGRRVLTHVAERCDGCGACHAVCPLGVWELDDRPRAVLVRREDCTACGACLRQCTTGAIKAPRQRRSPPGEPS